MFGFGRVALPPVAANPNVTASMPDIPWANPNRAHVRTHNPGTANPYPTVIPIPVARRPDICRTGRHRHYFDLGGRRRVGRGDGVRRCIRRLRAIDRHIFTSFHTTGRQRRYSRQR